MESFDSFHILKLFSLHYVSNPISTVSFGFQLLKSQEWQDFQILSCPLKTSLLYKGNVIVNWTGILGSKDIQPRNLAYIRLLNKSYENEVILTEQNLC